MIPEITVCGMLFHLYYKSCRRAAILAIFLVFVGHGGSIRPTCTRLDSIAMILTAMTEYHVLLLTKSNRYADNLSDPF